MNCFLKWQTYVHCNQFKTLWDIQRWFARLWISFLRSFLGGVYFSLPSLLLHLSCHTPSPPSILYGTSLSSSRSRSSFSPSSSLPNLLLISFFLMTHLPSHLLNPCPLLSPSTILFFFHFPLFIPCICAVPSPEGPGRAEEIPPILRERASPNNPRPGCAGRSEHDPVLHRKPVGSVRKSQGDSWPRDRGRKGAAELRVCQLTWSWLIPSARKGVELYFRIALRPKSNVECAAGGFYRDVFLELGKGGQTGYAVVLRASSGPSVGREIVQRGQRGNGSAFLTV